MRNIASNETVTLVIGKAEALILFELLANFIDKPHFKSKMTQSDWH